MNWLRNLAVLAVALLLTNTADAAGKAKKKVKPEKGTVVKVDKDSLVVKTVVGKKKSGNVTATEKTFKTNDTTKIEKVVGKKVKGAPATPGTPLKLDEIKAGDNVLVTSKDGTASEIKVATKKAKKKKTK